MALYVVWPIVGVVQNVAVTDEGGAQARRMNDLAVYFNM